MNSSSHLTLLAVALCLLLKLISCSEYEKPKITKLYVKPDNTVYCPDWITAKWKCEPLSYYIQNVDQYFVSNTCMEFLEGDHVMESNRAIRMKNVTNFSLIGNLTNGPSRDPTDGSPMPSSRIMCSGSMQTGFYFVNSSNIVVDNLAITQCGLRLGRRLKVLAALAFDTVLHVEIRNVRIYNCTGFGVHADLVLGNSSISDSAFIGNVGTEAYYGGNVRFWYRYCPPDLRTSLLIEKSWFKYGYDIYKTGSFYPYASGLTLLIDCPFVDAFITNITAVHNVAENGGNLAIRLNFTSYQPGIGSVLLQNSNIVGGEGHRGGGLRVWSRTVGAGKVSCSELSQKYVTLRVVNTTFIGNHANSAGGALYVSHYEEKHIDCVMRAIRFEGCVFQNNSVPPFGNGAVTEIIKHKIPTIDPHVSPQFQVVFSRSQFINNWVILDEKRLVHGGIVDIFSVDRITFESCVFSNNNSTALSVVDSNVVLSGGLVFSDNVAVNGGAIKFCDSSYMYIENHTSVLFEGNYASNSGGAIFAQQRCLETSAPCFFQPLVKDFTRLSDFYKHTNMTFRFVNNSAGNAGNAVYGGSIDYCFTFQHFVNKKGFKSYYLSEYVFNKIFNMSAEDPNNDVSSNPYGVCLCNSETMEPLCNKDNKLRILEPKYPGEEFQVMAVTVGQRSGYSPAVVNGVVIGLEGNQSKVLNELTTEPLRRCTWLRYSVHTKKERVTFNLTVQQANPDADSFYYRYHYPQIVVPLKPCPWGFNLERDSAGMMSCECHDTLKENGVKCNLSTGFMTRHGLIWVGFDWSKFKSVEEFHQSCQNMNTSDYSCRDVVVSDRCPCDYCSHSEVSIDASTIDKQCNFDRSGIMCGACGKGLSSTFGGSNCKKCNNNNIVPLIVFFIIAGLLLVFLLILLNLTVTEGTLNGLIFYMNIIQVNKSVYFPAGQIAYGVQILLGIVAWFNLDLGFSICFYSGMDAYVKTWLQFVFPVYIWLIVAVIIVLSRKFVLIQRLIGKNAVKILATLFLLSVAKLGRAIIAVLSYVSIKYPSGQCINIWTPDGNIQFLRGKHVPLFLVGLFFLVLTLLYTFLVMFVMCLQRLPSKAPFALIYRLKPFLDAYTGPYKTRCRFWTGLLLLTRCLLFTLFSLNDLSRLRLKLMFTILTCLLLLSLMTSFYGVYKRLYLNLLEMLAFLNLGVLSSLSCFLAGDGNTVIVSSVSVMVACATFIVVVFFHSYRQIRSSNILRKFLSSISRTSSSEELMSPSPADLERPASLLTQTEVILTPPGEAAARELLQNMNSVVAGNGVPEVARFARFREPLIESDSDS